MNQWKSFFLIVSIQVFLILPLCLYLDSMQKVNSVITGSSVGAINFLLLWILWYVVVYKKRVAPLIPLVVFKYSILVILLAFFGDKIEDKWFFTIGVLSVPFAITIFVSVRSWKITAKDS